MKIVLTGVLRSNKQQFPIIDCVRKVGLKVDNYFEHRIIRKHIKIQTNAVR